MANLDLGTNFWWAVFDFNDEQKTGVNWSLLPPEECVAAAVAAAVVGLARSRALSLFLAGQPDSALRRPRAVCRLCAGLPRLRSPARPRARSLAPTRARDLA